jgi:hypothetical protein
MTPVQLAERVPLSPDGRLDEFTVVSHLVPTMRDVGTL